jgi:hypothetical protein
MTMPPVVEEIKKAIGIRSRVLSDAEGECAKRRRATRREHHEQGTHRNIP